MRVQTGTGKPGKMGEYFPVREKLGNLFRLKKSRNFTPNTGKVWKMNKLQTKKRECLLANGQIFS